MYRIGRALFAVWMAVASTGTVLTHAHTGTSGHGHGFGWASPASAGGEPGFRAPFRHRHYVFAGVVFAAEPCTPTDSAADGLSVGVHDERAPQAGDAEPFPCDDFGTIPEFRAGPAIFAAPSGRPVHVPARCPLAIRTRSGVLRS